MEGSSSIFSGNHGPKNENFTVAPMGIFYFVMLTQKNPPMKIGEINGIYVAQVVLTNGRLGFGRTLPNFCRGRQFWATFSTRFGIGRTGRNVENQKHKY